MGKLKLKKSSCFKIIGSCSRGNSADGDASPDPESKTSSDKRRWSFWKRSAGHQVPSNTVTAEPGAVNDKKESQEVIDNDLQLPQISLVPEKAPIQDGSNGTPILSSASFNSEISVPLVPHTNHIVTDQYPQESDAVIIQAIIRGHTARRELYKLKSVVKLQAALRGHLVRRQAVGTLRCVQAIVKMQALIRARRACILSKVSPEQKEEKLQMSTQSPALLGERNTCINVDNKYSSTGKLLCNRFACKLMDSATKTKPIYISCDPSKSDSAWKWLERWMVVASSKGQQLEQNYDQGHKGHDESSKLFDLETPNENISEDRSMSELAPCKSSGSNDDDDADMTDKISDSFKFHTPVSFPDNCLRSSSQEDQDKSLIDNQSIDAKKEEDTNVERGQIQLQTDELSDKPVTNSNETKHTNASCESLEAERKEFVLGSIKPCNPAFAVVEPKFQDLSSTTLQVAASECGTEISISSTLNSPDRSEAEGGEIVVEIGSLKKQKYVDPDVSFHGNANTEISSSKLEVLQPERQEEEDENMPSPICSIDAMQLDQQSPEPSIFDLQTRAKEIINDRAPPEGTPQSHTTASEWIETPARLASVNFKKERNNIHCGKHRSQVTKKPPSNANNVSGGRSRMEHLQKDSKNAKNQNSLGITESDHVSLEPRTSTSSSNSLPSYMHATESARAKVRISISPKSSPDFHDKGILLKKRHSLPIVDAKHDSSPRLQRSTSQVQHNLKGTGTRSPHSTSEKRWQR